MTRSGNPYTQTTYQPTPVKYLARLDATNWGHGTIAGWKRDLIRMIFMKVYMLVI